MSCTTAEVSNQATELVDYNLFSSHSALEDALLREGAPPDLPALRALGERLGSAAISRLATAPPAAFGTLPPGVDCDALMARVLAP